MADLSTRRGQVRSERLAPIGQLDYQPVLITVQEHRADKRGTHYDLRITLPDRAISFVIPWDTLNRSPGTTATWIRQPDHTPEYSTWEGTIPKGEYGAGTVKVVARYPGVINSRSDGGLDLSYGEGDDQHRITINKAYNKNQHFAVVRNLPKEHHWQERPPYKDFPEDKPTAGYWASEKLDGALVYAVLGPKGITLTSRRRSTRTGKELIREHHVPWVRDTVVPKEYQGLVLAGELKHPAGFSFTGPLMNSKPERAVALQSQLGRMVFYPHNILNREMTYPERMALIEKMTRDMANPYIQTPRYSPDPQAMMDTVAAEGGEGVILVDPTGTDNTMYKKKFWDTYTGEIVDIIPSEKRPGTAGAMLVRDSEGNLVRVGGGKDFTLNFRSDLWKNRNAYKGRRIRVNAHRSTGTSLRQPQFGGFAMDDDPLDSFQSIEPVYSDFMPSKAASLQKMTDLERLQKMAWIDPRERRGVYPVRFSDFEKRLKPGDIILSKGNSAAEGPRWFRATKKFFSEGIGWVHAAMYVGDGKIVHIYGNAQPGAPTAVSGRTREHSLSTLVRTRNDLIALRPRVPVEERRQATERAREMLGTTYDYWGLVRTGLWPGKETISTETPDRPGKVLCSSLIAYAYPTLNVRPGIGRRYVRPVDFYLSSDLDTIATYSSERR